MLQSIMPSNSENKASREDEARARQKEDRTGEKDALKPTVEKIPEGEGNLRRRAEWFQKRTGGTP